MEENNETESEELSAVEKLKRLNAERKELKEQVSSEKRDRLEISAKAREGREEKGSPSAHPCTVQHGGSRRRHPRHEGAGSRGPQQQQPRRAVRVPLRQRRGGLARTATGRVGERLGQQGGRARLHLRRGPQTPPLPVLGRDQR